MTQEASATPAVSRCPFCRDARVTGCPCGTSIECKEWFDLIASPCKTVQELPRQLPQLDPMIRTLAQLTENKRAALQHGAIVWLMSQFLEHPLVRARSADNYNWILFFLQLDASTLGLRRSLGVDLRNMMREDAPDLAAMTSRPLWREVLDPANFPSVDDICRRYYIGGVAGMAEHMLDNLAQPTASPANHVQFIAKRTWQAVARAFLLRAIQQDLEQTTMSRSSSFKIEEQMLHTQRPRNSSASTASSTAVSTPASSPQSSAQPTPFSSPVQHPVSPTPASLEL